MIGFALFGCGRIGRVHARNIHAHAGAELVTCYDVAGPAAAAVAAELGASQAHSVDEALADPRVHAVFIASSTDTHVELIARSVQAGKAAFCEKPIDLDTARVEACWRSIARLRPLVMLGFNRRFDPSFSDIRSRVAAGEIGPLEQLTIISRDPAPPPAGYVTTSGGLFRDMTIHDFDMARYFLGEVVEVTATGANLVSPEIAEAGDIDAAVVVLRGASGALATITNSRRCAFGYDQRLEAFGELGMLAAANQLPTSVRFSGTLQDGLARTEVAPPYHNFFLDRYTPAYRAEMDAFVTGIEQGTAFDPGFADGRAALVLADAANESMRSGATVKVAG
jgi:myo-inositol 2-dehydrogenase/D-chiro-inositol 1-dehydrogenase